MIHVDTLSHLDEVRLMHGVDTLKVFWGQLVENDIEEAIDLINDEYLHFASVFALKTEILKNSVFPHLGARVKIALEIIKDLQNENREISFEEHLSSDNIQLVRTTLKWILETGAADDNLSDEFDEILDTSAILLIKVYRDNTILPIISKLIFERHCKGKFIHDLVWAFFECRDPQSLIMIANYLRSSNKKEIKLAQKLLGFIPGIEINNNADSETQYLAFITWLKENSMFLYFSGESLNQTSTPHPYVIVEEAKYLQKAVQVDTGRMVSVLNEKEHMLLENFKKLNTDTKNSLAHYSAVLINRNSTNWNHWLNRPLDRQLRLAKGGA